MSQPVALIARISMPRASFTRLLRSKAAKSLAVCIDETLDNNISNYYIFRYLKPRESLFAFIYFNYGNAASLKVSRELEILKAAVQYAGAGEAGYILTHLDALNLNEDGLGDSWMVVDQACVPTKQLPPSLWSELAQDAEKYFYKETKRDFALNFARKRIVNKSIVKRCQAMAENRRIEKLSTRLHLASFFQPLYLFGGYFFNGEYVYSAKYKIGPLREIDINSFKPTPFGAVDAKHAVIGGWVLEVDVASFKKLQKGEVTFYKDAYRVFNEKLEAIPQADAASFQLINDYYAEDCSYVYCCGEVIAKTELGAFEPHPDGYFHGQKLLIGERGIYQGANRLALDPATFQVISIHQLSRGFAFDIAYFVSDKSGSYLLTSENDDLTTPIQIVTEDPIDAVAQLHEAEQARRIRDREKFPPDDSSEANVLDRFRDWADNHLSRLYLENRYKKPMGGGFEKQSWFYRAVNNYLFLLFKVCDYDTMLQTYQLVEDTAWFNPSIYHHTACCYAALGQVDEAVAEVQKARDYGYQSMDTIWTDNDLSLIHEDPRFLKLREIYGNYDIRVVPLKLIQKLVELPGDVKQEITEDLIIKYSKHLYLPSLSKVRGWLKDADAEMQSQLKAYEEALRIIYNERLLLNDFSYDQDKYYRAYQGSQDLSVIAHLHAVEYYFRQMHAGSSIDAKYLGYLQEALDKVRLALATEKVSGVHAQLSEELKNNDFLAYVVDRLTGEDDPISSGFGVG